MQSENS